MIKKVHFVIVSFMKVGAVKPTFTYGLNINIGPYFPNLLTDLAEIRYNISEENAVEHGRFS
jgi:hypothetical protein